MGNYTYRPPEAPDGIWGAIIFVGVIAFIALIF
jgi:hypothetical protein